MIKGIVGTGCVQVLGGYLNYPYFSMNANNPLIGVLRYNAPSQNMEVFDGNTWVTISTAFPSVGLSPHTEAVLAWATGEMVRAEETGALAAKYPAVKDLLEQQADIQQKIDMVLALVKQQETT